MITETQLSNAKIEIFSAPWCGYCHKAKELLDQHDLSYEVIDMPTNKQLFLERTGNAQTIPQIFVDGELIGGYDQLVALFVSNG